jgi:uncharacterized protein YeaO (DUF488 family)
MTDGTDAPQVRARRVYEPAEQSDGKRVVTGSAAGLKAARFGRVAQAVAPSSGGRCWYGHQPGMFAEFKRRYEAEMTEPERARALRQLCEAARSGPVTLLTASRDLEHSAAAVLAARLRSG